jgi:hypothetical protein
MPSLVAKGVWELEAEWAALINGGASEAVIQDFLERHPVFLPGLWDLHNGPLHDIVVTKLPLGADFQTDFAFVTRHSMALQFTFIEIEAPSKRIFNKDGSFSQEFNHARQQVADWVLWSNRNIHVLMDMFGPMFETYPVGEDNKDVRGYLLYGRREEVEADRKNKQRWQSVWLSSDKRIVVMSYDRIRVHPADNIDLVVCTYQNRGFYAKSNVI